MLQGAKVIQTDLLVKLEVVSSFTSVLIKETLALLLPLFTTIVALFQHALRLGMGPDPDIGFGRIAAL